MDSRDKITNKKSGEKQMDKTNAFPFLDEYIKTDGFNKATKEVFGKEGSKNLLGEVDEDGYTIAQRLANIYDEVRPEITRINELNECTVFNPVATEMLEDLQNIIHELKMGEIK